MVTSNHTAFQKGHRRVGGRQKGVPNKTTAEVKAACTLIVDDEEYRAGLLKAARSRTLAPAMECLLWYYAKGKPRDHVEHAGGVAVTEITQDQLKHMTTAELEQARKLFRKMVGQSAGSRCPSHCQV